MDREIKFRAWDKDDKSMIVHEQPFIPLKVTNFGVFKLDMTSVDDKWILINRDRFEIMQFTGLKDKNGREIYEEDIVKGLFSVKVGEYTRTQGRKTFRFSDYQKREILCVVNYSNGKYMANSDFKEYYKTGFWAGCGRTKAEKEANRSVETCTTFNKLLSEVCKEIEIIGNIYENPELLNPRQLEPQPKTGSV